MSTPNQEVPSPVMPWETPPHPRPKFIHLRVYDLEQERYQQRGGVTLAYSTSADGVWLRVGASFCSLEDMYCKDGIQNDVWVGRRAADVAYHDAFADELPIPYWHLEGGGTRVAWDLVACMLQQPGARGWVRRALAKGLTDTWELRPWRRVHHYDPHELWGDYHAEYIPEPAPLEAYSEADVPDDPPFIEVLEDYTPNTTEAIGPE